MGMSQLADAYTGMALSTDEPAVALVIARQKHGYPDPVKAAAKPVIYPHDLFIPVALPIHGKVGSYGDFQPDKGQLSVEILCKMTKTENWQKFAEQALDWDKGVILERGAEPEVLGLCVVSKATWDAMIDSYRRRDQRAGDISLVKSAMLDAADSPSEHKIPVGAASDMLGLTLSRRYTFTGTDKAVEMPPLAHTLTELDCVGHMGSPLRSYLQLSSGEIYWDLAEKGSAGANHAYLDELLGALWDFQAFHYGIHLHNRYIMPSKNGGQHANDIDVARLSAATIEHAVGKSADYILDMGSERVLARLEAFSAELEAMQQRVAERIKSVSAEIMSFDEETGEDKDDLLAP